MSSNEARSQAEHRTEILLVTPYNSLVVSSQKHEDPAAQNATAPPLPQGHSKIKSRNVSLCLSNSETPNP